MTPVPFFIQMNDTIRIKIESPPSNSSISSSRHKISQTDLILQLTQECDSYIDLVINGRNVLNGYEGAYVYPIHAFLKTLNNGLASVLSSGSASVPIYLQQYSFSEDSPHHQLSIRLGPENDTALLNFSWCTTIRRPSGVPLVFDSVVLIEAFRSELRKNIVDFKSAATALLSDFDSSSEKEVAKLFAEFLPLRE